MDVTEGYRECWRYFFLLEKITEKNPILYEKKHSQYYNPPFQNKSTTPETRSLQREYIQTNGTELF